MIFLPLVATKLTDPQAWQVADLPFAFVMLAAVGLVFEFALRVPERWAYRAGAALALATAFLLTWGNLAVGFAGSEDNAINMIFFTVPGVALAGSLIARLRPAGLAGALACTAAAQIAGGVVAWGYGYFTGPLTVSFTGLWLAAALSFLRASRASAPAGEAV